MRGQEATIKTVPEGEGRPGAAGQEEGRGLLYGVKQEASPF